MTYCLGILLADGVLMASDSCSNAGVDQVASIKKMAVFRNSDERAICITSAGNLGTTQSVVTEFRHGFNAGNPVSDLAAVPTMFDAARLVGDKLRFILNRDADHVQPYGDPAASFLVGGQIKGDRPRIFQIYSAGNFVEATNRTPFVQIGETKYGKPVLDRALNHETTIAAAAKVTLLSFDATMRSNLSVGPPIDMFCYSRDSYAGDIYEYQVGDPYWEALRVRYNQGIIDLVEQLPTPAYP